MGAIYNIGIKHSEVEDIIASLEDVYEIRRKVQKVDSLDLDEFIENGARTFVVHQEVGIEWVQLAIHLRNLYEIDEVLRRITKKFQTFAFIGYNQTTSGNFRFAYFQNGKLKRSILQEYIESHNHMRIMDNFGEKLWFEKIDLGVPFTKEMRKEELLDYETLNKWYQELKFTGNFREGVTYFHLEIKKFKN